MIIVVLIAGVLTWVLVEGSRRGRKPRPVPVKVNDRRPRR